MKIKKSVLISLILVLLVLISLSVWLFLFNKKDNQVINNDNSNKEVNIIEENVEEVDQTVDIYDYNSSDRSIAIVVNNTPVAVKAQEGLNKSYLIYEFPTEGSTTRLMALYKDIEDLKVGTIRSARHNFMDYAFENDALFVHFGHSHYALDEEKVNGIDYFDGVYGGPFWRENPLDLATEHTAYTSIGKIREYASIYGNRMESNVKPPIDISPTDINLNGSKAVDVVMPYGYSNKEHFKYNENNKMYERYFNDEESLDYSTKEIVKVKNIIITNISYSMCSDNHYWDLHDTGSGTGYFITNGKYVNIKWTKESRNGRTSYTNLDGTPLKVSDGLTWISLVVNSNTEIK